MTDYLTWLASLDEDALVDLFRHRPEVLHDSAPVDLADVEARLTVPAHLVGALLNQPRPAMQALTALLLLGGRASVSQCGTVLEPTTSGDHVEAVRPWLARLQSFGLAWLDDADADVFSVAPDVDSYLAVPDDWGTSARTLLEAFPKDALTPMLQAWSLPRQKTKPATVAVLAEAFGDPERLGRQLARLTAQQREVLAAVDDLRRYDQAAYNRRIDAYRAAEDAGLLFALYAYSPLAGEVPTEVLMSVRGRRLPFDPEPPPLPSVAVDVDVVDRESRAALEAFNEASLSVLDHLRAQPVKRLQGGGVGTREIARVAKASKVDPAIIRLVLDLAIEAELLDDSAPSVRWSALGDAWRELEAGPRAVLLLEHWMTLPRSPTRSHDTNGKALPAGDRYRRCFLCREGRLTALRVWAAQTGAVPEATLATVVAWLCPLAHTTHREPVTEPDARDYRYHGRRDFRGSPEPPPLSPDDQPDLGQIAQEARLLGLAASGAGTPLLRALLGEDRAALVTLVDAMLPAASTTATFGSDLTAVVVGPPTGTLSALLDSCADRESRGGAVTWRFTTASVRRALDGGMTAALLAARLAEVAVASLPQPLTYLLADVGRRHGALRVAPAVAVIRCEDEALLAEVAVDRKLRHLAVRLVAPTVAVSAVGEGETIAALRSAGYLPMPESEKTPLGEHDGSTTSGADLDAHVVDLASRRPARSAAQGAPSAPTAEPESPASAAARLVGQAVAPGTPTADPRLVSTLRRANRTLSDREIIHLADAILRARPVRIRYRSATSAVTERVVSELAFSDYLLSGWCHLRRDERDFRVDQILSVAPV